MKQYLYDLLSLVETLQDGDMQRAVLKQIHSMAAYFACFPKLVKKLNKCLVEKWATGESHIQVLAFLALRRVVLFQSHPALHTLLKVTWCIQITIAMRYKVCMIVCHCSVLISFLRKHTWLLFVTASSAPCILCLASDS